MSKHITVIRQNPTTKQPTKRPIESGEKMKNKYDDEQDPISLWFELSYAQYLTIPRSIMESMSLEWQRKFATLLDELDDTFNWRPTSGRYWVQLKNDSGRYVNDPLMEYRRPNYKYIESIKNKLFEVTK